MWRWSLTPCSARPWLGGKSLGPSKQETKLGKNKVLKSWVGNSRRVAPLKNKDDQLPNRRFNCAPGSRMISVAATTMRVILEAVAERQWRD